MNPKYETSARRTSTSSESPKKKTTTFTAMRP
jgi:hypothetical protein